MKEFWEYINNTLEELIFAFSNVLNLVDIRLHDHHKQVAYIAYEIAKGLNLPEKKIKEVIMLGLIHDIGAFKQEEIEKKIRYSAYKEAGLIKEQEKLAKELVFDGQFEYYKELKRLSKKEDFYNNFKKELKSTVPFKLNVYTKLIEEENDLEEIMELIRKNILKIEEYAEMLVDTFKDEVIEMYESFIKSVANTSSNRNNYKEVCRKIK